VAGMVARRNGGEDSEWEGGNGRFWCSEIWISQGFVILHYVYMHAEPLNEALYEK